MMSSTSTTSISDGPFVARAWASAASYSSTVETRHAAQPKPLATAAKSVRGQRTRTNARTRKGRRKTTGGPKKK